MSEYFEKTLEKQPLKKKGKNEKKKSQAIYQ